MRPPLFPFFLLTLIVLVFGCEKKSGSPPMGRKVPAQSIRINITSEPRTLDPRKARLLSDINLIKTFNEGLTRIDQQGKASLALAKCVDISEDGLTYRFSLRSSTWSNGAPLTSRDFVYAWKKSLSPTFTSENSHMLYVIKNGEKVKSGKLPSSLLGVETPDDQTLVIHLSYRAPYLLELLEHPIFFPVNETRDRFDPKWAEDEKNFLSNGPFKLSQWKHHDFIEAVKNQDYWDAGAVKIDAIKMCMVSQETGFQMFESKELDWDGSPFSVIPTDAIESLKKESRLGTAPCLVTQWIGINTNQSPFDSKKFRRAFALAINRKDIVDHVTQGGQTPATGIVPETMGLQDQPYFEDGHTEFAATLFEEALVESGLTRETLPEIVLSFPSESRAQAICQAVQQQWLATLGVHVKLQSKERRTYYSQLSNQDAMLFFKDWVADFNDPITFLELFLAKSNKINFTNWENSRYEELLESSYACKDPEERLNYLKQSEQLIMDEMPVIPIYYSKLLFVKDDAVKNVVITKTGCIDFKWAEVNQ